MAKDKVNMPSSIAGLTRYFDDFKSNLELKPTHVIILIVLVIIVALILNSQSVSILG